MDYRYPNIIPAGLGYLLAIFLSVVIYHYRTTVIIGIIGCSINIALSVLGWPLYFWTHLTIIAAIVIFVYLSWILKTKIFQTHRNQRQFQALFEHATQGIILSNKWGIIEFANPFSLQQFGYSEKEMIGGNIEMLVPVPLRTKHQHLRYNFIQHPKNRPMGVGLDLKAIRKDGTTFPVEISLSHYTINGEPYFIAFITDISVRKQSEEAILQKSQELERISREMQHLNQNLEKKVSDRTLVLRETLHALEKSKDELAAALEKEKELNDLKTRFLSMASHEFRTPLSTILSSVTLISKYTQSEEQDKRDRHIHRIRESVNNLTYILEDFLCLGKIEEGKINANFEWDNISEFVEKICEEKQDIAKTGQHIVHVHEGELCGWMDKYIVRNILINLINNAIKFSPEHSTICVVSIVGNAQLILQVKDEGIGISKEDQQHLFDRFFRGSNAMNIQGTGLGLHIIARYLEIIDGKINFKSELGKGSNFTVTLPQISKSKSNGKDSLN